MLKEHRIGLSDFLVIARGVIQFGEIEELAGWKLYTPYLQFRCDMSLEV